MLNCGIGWLGCEFIGRLFHPKLPTNLNYLTLDYNNFGNDGLNFLMAGLKGYDKIKYISLAYCGITEDGIKHMKEFLTSPSLELEKLILQGNELRNSGFNEMIDYLYNSNIEEINLNNILIGNDTELMLKFTNLMAINKNLVGYQLRYNFIDDKGNLR
jgi:Ran GTPase-activating protein (RanGAP) involved in mRNA processing and transport